MEIKWNDHRRGTRRYITQSAFADWLGDGDLKMPNYKPTWTIADEDHDGLYSFKKWFLKYYRDPTETQFVDACFEGDLRHWNIFKNTKTIKVYYEEAKREAEQRLLKDIMSKIVETAMDDNNKSQMVALKYLAERGAKILEADAPTRGRPKKADVEKAAREIAEEDKAAAADLKRILG